MSIKLAVCQVPDIRMNIDASLGWIEKFTSEAELNNISVVCFPECFLQGYLTDFSSAKKYAIDLESEKFRSILQQLKKYKPVIIVGMIERCENSLFNTAAVIKMGQLVGRYRKTHLLKGERIFTPGSDYPVFETNGITFGINICYDTQFSEAAKQVVARGAKVIFCPANNMMRYETAEKFKHLHHEMRIQRVKETGVWLLSSDVTGEYNGRISYGPTSVISPDGEVVKQIPLMETGMIYIEMTNMDLSEKSLI